MKPTKAFLGNSKFFFGLITFSILAVYGCNSTAEKTPVQDTISASPIDSGTMGQDTLLPSDTSNEMAHDTAQPMPEDTAKQHKRGGTRGVVAPPPKP